MVTCILFRVGWLYYKPVLKVLFYYLGCCLVTCMLLGVGTTLCIQEYVLYSGLAILALWEYIEGCLIIQGLLCWTVTCMRSGAGTALWDWILLSSTTCIPMPGVSSPTWRWLWPVRLWQQWMDVSLSQVCKIRFIHSVQIFGFNTASVLKYKLKTSNYI